MNNPLSLTLSPQSGRGEPIPAALAKRGITTLSDNLQPGECLSISRAFITFFRPELEARFITGGKQPCVNNNSSSPCRSGK